MRLVRRVLGVVVLSTALLIGIAAPASANFVANCLSAGGWVESIKGDDGSWHHTCHLEFG